MPGGIQGYDRYAYVSNNPLRYVDRSGHKPCDLDNSGACIPSSEPFTKGQVVSRLRQYNVTISGNWSFENAFTVFAAVDAIGARFALTRGLDESASEAFGTIYGHVNMSWEARVCEINGSTCWGYAGNFPDTIQIYEKYWAQGVDENGNIFQYQASTPVTPYIIIHELAHAFNVLAKRQPESDIYHYDGGSLLVRPDGFAPHYSFGQDNSASEIFADMFVGWVSGGWRQDNLGPVRAQVMITNISNWITETQNNR